MIYTSTVYHLKYMLKHALKIDSRCQVCVLHTESDDCVDDPAHTHKHAEHEAEHHQETCLLGRPLATSDVAARQGCPRLWVGVVMEV